MSLTPLLRCHDLTQTERFYVDVLGFTAIDGAGDTLTVEMQGRQAHLHAAGSLEEPTYVLWHVLFRPGGCDCPLRHGLDKASIGWPLQQMPYGSSEFGVMDCNGHHLAFRQQT